MFTYKAQDSYLMIPTNIFLLGMMLAEETNTKEESKSRRVEAEEETVTQPCSRQPDWTVINEQVSHD